MNPGLFGLFWVGFLLAGTFGAGIWPSGLDLGLLELLDLNFRLLGPPGLYSGLLEPPGLDSVLQGLLG